MRLKTAIVILLQILVSSKGQGIDVENLYEPRQAGIVSFEEDEVVKNVVNSSKPWLIQFYASWCGHCRHFRPTFSKFGVQVQGWTDLMGIGVVNCASERNTQTCRNYDVESYPTVKLFPPNSPAENLGKLADKFHTVQELLTTTADWIEKQQSVPENARYFVNSPNLTPLESLDELWSTAPSSQKAARHAILLITEETEDYSLGEIILDLFAVTKNLSDQLVVRKVYLKKTSGISIVKKLKVGFEKGNLPALIGVDRNLKNVTVIGKEPKKASKQVLKSLIYQHCKKLFHGKDLEKAEEQMKAVGESERPVTKVNREGQSVEAIRRRRYVAHLLDAEIALEYSLSHEVGQRKVIEGRSLTALQNFMQVLAKYFPGQKRPRTIAFIKELRTWTGQHDDLIRGEDFARKVKEIKQKLGAFSHEQTSYIGCKGTAPIYGGYTCGLWTLWHMLTAGHLDVDANSENLEENRFVVMTMYHYIESFFGCRDCARHFKQMAENGEAITRDVRTVSDSVLWLWRAHNRVNQRLSGDITDDPGFPKMIFPDKDHCPNCYDKVATHDLWQEFNKDSVRDFLLNLYSTDLEYEGLKKELLVTTENQDFGVGSLVPGEKPVTAHKNLQVSHFYRVRTTWFMSVADISLCALIYVGSFLLLIVICYKLECCSKRHLIPRLQRLLKTRDHFGSGNRDPLKMV